MVKSQNKFETLDIILMIITILLIIINLILYSKKFLTPQDDFVTYQTTTVVEGKEEKLEVKVATTDEEIIKELSEMNERERMEYYCGKYLKYIEDKDYESAYNLLYMEFRKNYFPTYEDYVEYIEKTYLSELAVEYDDITRQGTIYVLRLKLIDMLGDKTDEQTTQRIVIQENYYNDFVISFQVI